MRTPRTLAKNESGAVFLVGLFMILILIGIMAYVHGLGNAIFYRERMQDAADSAAFSAAVLHARGMNLIALINIVMSTLVAVLVAFRLIEATAVAAILTAAALALPSGGASLAAIPYAEKVREAANQAFAASKPWVISTLKYANQASTALAAAVPPAADTLASTMAATKFAPLAKSAFIYPDLTSSTHHLPVRDDVPITKLCSQAVPQVDELATSALQAFGPVASVVPVEDLLNQYIASSAAAFAFYMCGMNATGTQPASTPPRIAPSAWVDKPESDAMLECRSTGDQTACEQGQEDWSEGIPPESSDGLCNGNAQCETMESLAKAQCPAGTSSKFKDYRWTEQPMQYTFKCTPSGTKTDTEVVEAGNPVQARGSSPCTEYKTNPVIDSDSGQKVDDAICLRDVDSIPDCPTMGPSTTYVVDFVRVRKIITCKKNISSLDSDIPAILKPVAMDVNLTTLVDPKTVAPKELDYSPAPNFTAPINYGNGEEDFQLRAFVIGDAQTPGRNDLRDVNLANRLRSITNTPTLAVFRGLGESLGRYSSAQAEYFYNGDSDADGTLDPIDMWLWHMDWKARLRRVHIDPQGAMGGAIESRCQSAGGGDCAAFVRGLKEVNDVIVH